MYLSHFHLDLKPFQVNTDKRFLYLSEKHKEALAILHYGINDNRGVLVLTGDVGTGKTILVHALVETLGPEVQTAVITDPGLQGLDFFNFMAHKFGMGAKFNTKGEFLINFSDFLDGLFEANQQALLIIDEAQYKDPVQLEELRILSDLEHEHNRRLNIFFVGQGEFDTMLADTRLRALKQRITTHYHIEPLTLKETGLYVQHRLKVAGCDRPLFTRSALKKIFGLTNGYPRLINILCDHCLLSAFVKGLHQVDPAIVKECAADLMHPSQLNQETPIPLENGPRLASPAETDIQPADAPKTPPVDTTQTTTPSESSDGPKPFGLRLPTFLRKPAFVLAVAVLLAALVWLYFMGDRDLNRQSASPSPTIFQEKQVKADVGSLESSAPNKDRDAPQLQAGQIQAPANSISEASAEQQLINAAAAQFDLSKLTPVEVDLPVDTHPTVIEKGGTESMATEGAPTLPEEAVPAPAAAPIENEPDPTAQSDVDDGPSPLASAIDASTVLPEEAVSAPAAAPTENQSDPTAQPDVDDGPSPLASAIDASIVSVDEPPQELAGTPPPATPSTEPAAGEREFQDTESDPRAIIDFLIRKRAQQPGSQ